MRLEQLSLALSEKKHGCFLIVCALALFCLCQSALAQSGRRQAAKPAPPSPASEAKPESEAHPTTAKPAPVATLIVGGDRSSASLDIPEGLLDVALDACLARLRKSTSLDVTSGGSSMRRKAAIDEAKKQSDAYVVWLELKVERHESPAPSGVTIEYSVFTPQTAKVKNFGRVYLDGTRRGSGRVRVGVPSVTRNLPLEYLMKEGGQAVADRIMDMFHVSLPD